jgi:hypothetical protein
MFYCWKAKGGLETFISTSIVYGKTKLFLALRIGRIGRFNFCVKLRDEAKLSPVRNIIYELTSS